MKVCVDDCTYMYMYLYKSCIKTKAVHYAYICYTLL